jgi:serine/threonine protein kinase
MFEEIAKGIRFLHKNGIVHRDLKLGNLMLTEDLHVVRVKTKNYRKLETLGSQ